MTKFTIGGIVSVLPERTSTKSLHHRINSLGSYPFRYPYCLLSTNKNEDSPHTSHRLAGLLRASLPFWDRKVKVGCRQFSLVRILKYAYICACALSRKPHLFCVEYTSPDCLTSQPAPVYPAFCLTRQPAPVCPALWKHKCTQPLSCRSIALTHHFQERPVIYWNTSLFCPAL